MKKEKILRSAIPISSFLKKIHFSIIMCKCPKCRKELCQTFGDHRFCWSCLRRFTLGFKEMPKVDVIKGEVKQDYKENYQFEREKLR